MSSTECSRYTHEELGVKMPPAEVSAAVVRRMEGLYRECLPLILGAREAVGRVAARWPLGLASSANRPVIEVVLELSVLGRPRGSSVATRSGSWRSTWRTGDSSSEIATRWRTSPSTPTPMSPTKRFPPGWLSRRPCLAGARPVSAWIHTYNTGLNEAPFGHQDNKLRC